MSNPRMRRVALVTILVAIFLTALALRVYGNNFGLPYSEEDDEPAIMNLALTMLQSGDWNPHWYSYPTMYIYVQSLVTWLYFLWAHAHGLYANISQFAQMDGNFRYLPQSELYAWGRTVSGIIGASTCLVLYGAASKLYSRTVGVVAAILMTFAWLHVQYSHFIRVDIPLTFFVTLALLTVAYLLKRGRVVDYVTAGMAIGLTAASKYTGAIIALPVVLAHLLHSIPRLGQASRLNALLTYLSPRRHLLLVLSAVVSLAAFFSTMPFALFDLATFRYWLGLEVDFYGYQVLRLSNASHYLEYFQQRGGFGEILTVLAIAGFGFALFRHRHEDLAAAIFPLAYFFFMMSWTLTYIRTALPLVPFLALFAALSIVAIAEFAAKRLPRSQFAKWGLVASLTGLTLVGPVQKILPELAMLPRATEKMIATQWANDNLPEGAHLMSEGGGIRINRASQIPPIDLKGASLASLQTRDLDYVVAVDASPEALRPLDSSLVPLKTFMSQGPAGGPTIRIMQVPIGLQLKGLSFDKPSYEPGTQARFTLHWSILSALHENYVESIRLVNLSNDPAFEFTGMPQVGTGRTKSWIAGRVITDTQLFTLPADLDYGRYTIQVGVYRPQTQIALLLGSPNGTYATRIDSGTIKVGQLDSNSGIEPQQKMFASFEGIVGLDGFSMGSLPTTAGQEITLNLFWSATTEIYKRYTRFVHMVDGTGKIVAQVDSEPCAARCPTSVWIVGDTISDSVELQVPASLAAGEYSLFVGWYEYPSLMRLTTGDGTDQVLLKRIEVQ